MTFFTLIERKLNTWLSMPSVLTLCKAHQSWVWWLSILLISLGVIGGLFIAPNDVEMGDGFRIIYVHVPMAALSMAVYTFMTVCGIGFYVYNNKTLAIFIRKASAMGILFTSLTLITGSIWGARMWGAWWVWGDARLVSELILLFLYIGHATLLYSLPNNTQSDKLSAILLMVGFVNIPIIHYSVYWWTSLHQTATLFKLGAPEIPMSMLWPLLCTLLGFGGLFVASLMTRTSSQIMRIQSYIRGHYG